MKTIIVWFRNDLRTHDHPALTAAIRDADEVLPVFIFNNGLLNGKHGGSNRNRFLLESLQDLQQNLRGMGADLCIRDGEPAKVLEQLVAQTAAEAVYYTSDFTSYALQRDKRVEEALTKRHVEFRGFAGRLIVSAVDKLRTQTGKPYTVFTPFYKRWQLVVRRSVASAPKAMTLTNRVVMGALPQLSAITEGKDLSPDVIHGGETAGRHRLETFLKESVKTYHQHNNNLGVKGTSRLSAYLHFGCISPREIESLLPEGEGAAAWHRQLAWRDFYNYVLFNFPSNATEEFQQRYRNMKWNYDESDLRAWQRGQTGYPVVDAAMRQLNTEGWMHNRARLIVGSFLTKDLGLDWRLGEAYFMKMLVDGDQSNNNGNWQWIASVGVDPAPLFRRLYNPVSQHAKFDPHNNFVRQFVPELKDVPDTFIREPWTMPPDVQEAAGCRLGSDYPNPIVDRKQARQAALERYK